MAKPPGPSLSDLTGEAVLTGAFERLRPRLVAMVERRTGRKLAVRIDPEGVVQDAFLRAHPRWLALESKPEDLHSWLYSQVRDRLIELTRGALGPSETSTETSRGRTTRLHSSTTWSIPRPGPARPCRGPNACAVVHAAIEKLDPLDREVLAMRHFDGLNYEQIGAILGMAQKRRQQARPPGHARDSAT